MSRNVTRWVLVAVGGAVLVAGAAIQSRDNFWTAGVFHPATLRVAGVRSGDGILRATICKEVERFPDDCELRSVGRASKGVVLIRFPKVEEGSYAAAVFHDENRNGRLDMHEGRRVPSEGVAFSNDSLADAGVPSFDQAKVKFDGSEQRLRIHYLR
jgi:uncharacterized protein (DUF2141 family)